MEILIAPNVKLRVKTKPVRKITPAHLATLKQMVKLTKTFKDPEGVGLASTQIGQRERFFVLKDTDKFIKVINPQILATGKRSKTYFEGCLSIPNIYGQIKRYTNIKVAFTDETGQQIKKSLKSVPAWIFQHEMDHLDGFLFPDKVLQQKGSFYKWKGRDKTGQDIFEEITL